MELIWGDWQGHKKCDFLNDFFVVVVSGFPLWDEDFDSVWVNKQQVTLGVLIYVLSRVTCKSTEWSE